MNKKITALVLVISLLVICSSQVFAGISYLPDVTSAMSTPSYWTDDSDVLMSSEEILLQNTIAIAEKGTNMNGLKGHSVTVDGVALNEALAKSTQADVSYYLGWIYLGSDKLATQTDFDPIIANTQNPDAKTEQKVMYGIVTKNSVLMTFPSDLPMWDDTGDKDLDYQCLVNVRVNEPLVITSVSFDGKYYLAKNVCCSGWIPVEDVAVCKDREEWLSAWDIENTLVVWGDKVRTQTAVTGSETSGLLLTMGTVLEVADIENPNVLIDNRAAYQNYVVYLPIRKEDGSYAKKLTLISEHEKVSEGYLPLTKSNIAKVAFSALGNVYGWGGGLDSVDCSGYLRNIYKCFGLELARNTTWQTAMPVAGVDMNGMCREERLAVVDALPFGSILFFKGHEMMYLGSENGKYYVISSVGSIMEPSGSGARQRMRSIVINTLDIKRANGLNWLDSLTYANVPYWQADEANMAKLPQKTWYHDGVAYCIEKKYMKGYDDGLFYPDNEITLAELVQLLYNMDGTKVENVGENWYDAALAWAKGANIITDAEFSPDNQATREQLAVLLYKYAQYKGLDTTVAEDTNILSYEDATKISEGAYEAFQYVVGSGILTGKTQSTLNPTDNLTRAEIATVIKRFAK